jgi:hypothetical protein
MINDHGLPHFKITPYSPPKAPPRSVAFWQRPAPGGADVRPTYLEHQFEKRGTVNCGGRDESW